ncbi:DNA-3-methyladenine glycosylase 2 family protein [Halomonas denitrificans]|nr:DNA-3-methyladenine glycosylase 2 family protein [Halomonas denitrificans]
MRFQLTEKGLKRRLDTLAEADPQLAEAIARVGYPAARRSGSPSYAHLLRILAGQQLSVKAAATIYGRLIDHIGDPPDPDALLDSDDRTLRSLGLSRQKIAYARGLSEAVRDGDLVPEALAGMDDGEVIDRLTALKGFGRWSAEMFLLFSLGRADVWPADDLGIQAGLQRLLELEDRPGRREVDRLGERWKPHRGAVAIFLWHLHGSPPA